MTFTSIHFLQCDPHQQEWLAHTPQLPLSHWADIWGFCRGHQSDQLTFCVSNCELFFQLSQQRFVTALKNVFFKPERLLTCWLSTSTDVHRSLTSSFC